MTADFYLPLLGNEALDSLREVQLVADNIDDFELKKAYLAKSVKEVSTENLLDEVFEVESAKVIGTLEALDRPRRFMFSEGMRFIGRAATYNYFVNPEEMIDYLTVTFTEPVVLRPEVVAVDFELFTFQVPVLAIDSFEEAF